MTFRQAAKLHNGDEVIDKETGESIRVITAFEDQIVPGKKCIMIEGVGTKQGYNHWQHTTVK
jgi:hypothetical protein